MSAISDDYGWIAYIAVDHTSLGRNAKLMMAQRGPYATNVVRIAEGGLVMTSVAEGEAVPADAGLDLPVEALNAIAKAIEAFQGDTGHAATEVRVLREMLAKEQSRVDAVLAYAKDYK